MHMIHWNAFQMDIFRVQFALMENSFEEEIFSVNGFHLFALDCPRSVFVFWIANRLFHSLTCNSWVLLQEQLLFDNYWLGAFKRSLSELSSLFALVPESWSSTWYDWLNNQKTPNSFLKNWNKKGWRCWCKNHVHYHLVYFQAGVRAMFWEIREEKRLRDFPSSKISKGKLRGPMSSDMSWYHSPRSGRFPSSVLVFSQDTSSILSSLNTFDSKEKVFYWKSATCFIHLHLPNVTLW